MSKWTVGVVVEYLDGKGKHFFLVDSLDPEKAINEAKEIAAFGHSRHDRAFYWASARIEITQVNPSSRGRRE